jgi:signal peptidase II
LKNKYILFTALTALILMLDQCTKFVIDTRMKIGESMTVIDGFFNLTYVRNPGAAFGFLASASPVFRSIFFLAVTAVAVALILYYIRDKGMENPWMTAALSLVLSGALGNLIDRVRFGEVIDFLDVYIGSYHWPAFNVADSAISIGAVVLISQMFAMRRQG